MDGPGLAILEVSEGEREEEAVQRRTRGKGAVDACPLAVHRVQSSASPLMFGKVRLSYDSSTALVLTAPRRSSPT
jgi:hypothetical protein